MTSSAKSILIVTPFFAPQTHAAVFRAYKLAKYLPRFGWKPYVLTVDTNYLYNEDEYLLADLPDDVEIVRTRYIEPTVRGVRMALGGADRTFMSRKSGLLHKAQGDLSANTGSATPGIPAQLYDYARRHWLNAPDAYWTWYGPAVRAGRDLIRRHQIDIVYSTALPYTSHRIGAELQKLGPKWVADFRDPATYAAKMSSEVGRVRHHQQDIVRHTLQTADAVTTLSSSYGLIFQDIYGAITRRPVSFIPTGVDDDLLPATDGSSNASQPAPYLMFVGEVMPDQTAEFFHILGHALQQTVNPHRLLVVGHEILNRQRLEPIARECGILERVQFIDHLPQRELYALLKGATAGILAPGHTNYWWNNHAKLVDYVGLQLPVLAVVPDPSEVRSVLTKTGLGVFLDGNDDQPTSTLVSFLDGKLQLPEPNATECDRYLASSQVKAFVDVFEELL